MIIISLRFDGGSTEEEHDIAHIASSIVARVCGLFFIFFSLPCAAALTTLALPNNDRCLVDTGKGG